MAFENSIVDLTIAPEMRIIQSNVCLIGSGPGGAVLACKLAAAGIDTLIIDAGSKCGDSIHDDIIEEYDIDGKVDLDFAVIRRLGGASSLWAGRTTLLDPIDYEPRDWIPQSGWPISHGDLEPYLREAAEIIGIPGYENFSIVDECSCFPLPEQLTVKPFLLAKQPFNTWDYLKKYASKHLRILTSAMLKNLYENEQATRVEHAEVVGIGGNVVKVIANTFVIAAGGIETPRILLNSTNVRSGGIGNDHGNVGHYFSTHPKADLAALVLNKPVSIDHPLFGNQIIDGGQVRYGLALPDRDQEQLGITNHFVLMTPLRNYNTNRFYESLTGIKSIRSQFIDRDKLVGGYIPGLGSILLEPLVRARKLHARASHFILRGFLDQFPNRDNRVYLGDSVDKLGNRRSVIHWRYSDRDRTSVISFFESLDQAFRRIGAGYVSYEKLKTMEEWPLTSIHSHFMGATRMGNDPENSVTDSNARVFGSENLYISGPSLFPTYGFANPFLTIMALSLRLADHLKTRLVV